jgi:hypothetical protein
MALVTLINGECRAGTTPQTVRYPMRPAKANVKKLPMNIGPVAFPNARAKPIPPVTVATSRVVFCHGVTATTSGALVSCAGLTGRGGGGAGRGAVGTMSPLYVTIEPRITSSFKSTPKCFSSGAIERRNLVILFEYSVDDCVGSREGRSVYPVI